MERQIVYHQEVTADRLNPPRAQRRCGFGRFFMLLLLMMILLVSGIAEETPMRSTSLRTVVTVEGNVERTDYVNEEGVITYAADKQYATVIRTINAHSELEAYYDAAGRPSRQPQLHFALLREYNEAGQAYKQTFLGLDGKPVLNRVGYAIIIRAFNNDGTVSEETYFDAEGKPVQTSYSGHGRRRTYDGQGRNTAVTFIDLAGLPTVTSQGYATVKQTFYESGPSKGRVKEKFYFDANGVPVRLYRGQFGLLTVYDEYGRSKELTYLDADGRPMRTTEGYTSVKQTFYPDDTVCTEYYFDQNGLPVRLSEGQYGLMYIDGRTVYLDADGNEIFNLRNFLHGSQLIVIAGCVLAVLAALLGNKKINLLLCAVYLLFIAYMTLRRSTMTAAFSHLELFWSYRSMFSDPSLFWSILDNILLFVPLGAILYRLCPRKAVLLIPLAISILIEGVQYFSASGLCELDDVINNSLGGVIGYGFAALAAGYRRRR